MLEITIDISNIISTDKTLESKIQENKYEYETIDQSKIKNLSDLLDEKIDKSKSFEDQIEFLKELEDLKEYLSYKEHDDKDLKFTYTLKYNLQICRMKLTKYYLNKYLVINL